MRKYIIGGLVGAALMMSFNVSAAVESIIGKSIQAEVKVNLNGVPLENKGGILDGVSYLPVRAIGESLGLNVDYQNGEVFLSKPLNQEVKPTVTTTTTQPSNGLPTKLENLEMQIKQKKLDIVTIDASVESLRSDIAKNPSFKEKYEKTINGQLEAKARLEQEIAELERQKAALPQQP